MADKEMEKVYKEQIAALTMKLELKEEENKLKDQMLTLKDREIEMERRSFESMKEIADRAIKLAETKKSNIWETYGPLAVIAVIVVTIASVF
jgi:t-SNARE complex subunit (syntaxin)